MDLWSIYLFAETDSDHPYGCYGNTKTAIFITFPQSLASVAILQNDKTLLFNSIKVHNFKKMANFGAIPPKSSCVQDQTSIFIFMFHHHFVTFSLPWKHQKLPNSKFCEKYIASRGILRT